MNRNLFIGAALSTVYGAPSHPRDGGGVDARHDPIFIFFLSPEFPLRICNLFAGDSDHVFIHGPG